MITLYLVFIFIYLFSDQKIGGGNFLFHSPSFTCDQDSRDSIMLRFNPQAEVHHDQINKDIIREASDALKKYLTYKYLNLTDVRFLCPINFVKGKSDNETNQYYHS